MVVRHGAEVEREGGSGGGWGIVELILGGVYGEGEVFE